MKLSNFFAPSRFSFSLVLLCLLAPAAASGQEKSYRIVNGLNSSDVLISDLKYLVADLAGREKSWEDNIFPNIDIFLVGVKTSETVRLDLILSETHGLEYQLIIPYDDIDTLINDNLDPIGIIPKRDRSDRDLYELTGNVYEGWMRVLKDPNYAVIFPRKEALPKSMENPGKYDDHLVAEGYGAFSELVNDPADIEGRRKAVAKAREKSVAALKKSTEETEAAFELRKLLLNQQLAFLEQWLSESTGYSTGTKLNTEQGMLTSKLTFGAIPETDLSGNIARIHNEPSYFAPITAPENAVFSGRIHMAYDTATADSFAKLYNQSRVVAHELIDENKDLSADQKKARKKVALLLEQILTQTNESKKFDGFLDIAPSGTAHSFLLGIRANGQAQLQELLDLVPQGQKGWKLEKDADEAEGVKIHKIVIESKIPQSLIDMYGEPAGIAYVAASDQAFWLAFGANSLEQLKSSITAVRTAKDVKSTDIVLSMRGHAEPLAKSLDSVVNDDLDLFSTLFARRRERRQASKPAEGEEDKSSRRQQAASSFLTFEWLPKVVDAMKGEDDQISFVLKYTEENTLEADGAIHKGILKAVGTMIANFADENLK